MRNHYLLYHQTYHLVPSGQLLVSRTEHAQETEHSNTDMILTNTRVHSKQQPRVFKDSSRALNLLSTQTS